MSLAKADARIERDLRSAYTEIGQSLQPRLEKLQNVANHIFIGRRHLHGLRRALHVHHDRPGAGAADHLRHVRLTSQSGHIIDDRGPGFERVPRDLGFRGIETPFEQRQIASHRLAGGVRLDAVRAQEISGDQRGDHARDEQAHQHRDDHGKAERLEELTGDSRHQRDRQEHRHDRHRGRKHRKADFVGGVD